MSEVITNAHVLSNGEYAVLLAADGGGYSALRGFALTRWQPDPIIAQPGVELFLRDLHSGKYWQATHGEAEFTGDHVQQTSYNEGVRTECRVGVLRAANAERRRIRITNQSRSTRRLELTTYAELCLNTPAADAAHPAFSKLFVQTAFDADRQALLAWRRLRSPNDRPLWVGQRLLGARQLEIESDRARFIGRTHSLTDPLVMQTRQRLSGTVGAVLDPIFAMRTTFEIDADESTELELLLCAADSRAELEGMFDATWPDGYASSAEADALGLPAAWRARLNFEVPAASRGAAQAHTPELTPDDTRAAYGRFSDDGTEYIMEVGRSLQPTPQPWINVIANEQCGFLVSETGAGYTWAANSRENRITPWSNDPVSDPHGEALYLRDDESGEFWSVLPGPVPPDATYEVRHGFGYSTFTHASHGISQQATLFVPRIESLKITRVQLQNESAKRRRLSLVWYAQLVLGGTAAETRGSVTTDYQDDVVYARNRERGEFAQRVTFATAVSTEAVQCSATCSRRSFFGEGGTLSNPAALRGQALDGEFGARLDPCAALQLSFTLEAGETFDCACLLGEAQDDGAAHNLVARYQSIAQADDALEAVRAFWRKLLGAVQVETHVPALDVMFNGWLAYQNLACRMWGRSAFYQSGGAFGFRDQLQDSSALLYLDPRLTREQILLHAAHQFDDGDVLHWWHPPTSKGIRTRFSDDLLWLPQIAHFYLASTGDQTLLDEEVRFVAAEALAEGEDERFVWPKDAGESASLYEHCCRALDRSLTRGTHGLPLMGVGDWNDGMNRVGREGHGESVWLGFFLFDILTNWIPICDARCDHARVQRYQTYRSELLEALNEGGWDGEWYRRAYYDDGTPLGSAQNDECRIDALAQAWSVISRAAPEERAAQALSEMQKQLVSEADGIIRLLTPAFDKTPHDPGYIKGYIPGVRENGGQYTHAALWAVRALAEHGEHERAAPLLEMLSPVTRSLQAETYRGEPFAIAADVYGEPPHVGRAGWTWYTGSAGWMYRVFLESILGFELRNGDTVALRPCIPDSWPGYSLRYRLTDGTIYNFVVARTDGDSSTSHGEVKNGAITIPLERDGDEHSVRIRAGADVRPRYRPRSSEAPLLRTTSA